MSSGARPAEHARQDGFAYRFDWGLEGLRNLAPVADVVIIVDVLRFTSAVCAALESGSTVEPFPWDREEAAAHAARHGAVLAGRREDGGPSLSPTDLLSLPPDTHLVLPSPNGAALSHAAAGLGGRRVLAGCLRNASATARFARSAAGTKGVIAVIAAGERWGEWSGPLRPAFEDLVGAGAILTALDPSGAVAAPRCSPEAAVARATFQFARPRLFEHLGACASGHELISIGWDDDVATSAALDVTTVVAELVDGRFVNVGKRC